MRRLVLLGAGLLVASMLKRRARALGPLGMVAAAGAADAFVNWLVGPDPVPFPPRPAWLERLINAAEAES